ncbi:MAG TPA: hypothetical protein VHM65_00040 [Candidatus Lustribacter sp.]|nr:hypothetical protein [Candidatus Lustribacter sp.]
MSDLDVAIASPVLLARAKEIGVSTRARGTRAAPLWSHELDRLGLRDLMRDLSGQAGRNVSFMVYASRESVLLRGDGIQ